MVLTLGLLSLLGVSFLRLSGGEAVGDNPHTVSLRASLGECLSASEEAFRAEGGG